MVHGLCERAYVVHSYSPFHKVTGYHSLVATRISSRSQSTDPDPLLTIEGADPDATDISGKDNFTALRRNSFVGSCILFAASVRMFLVARVVSLLGLLCAPLTRAGRQFER